MACHILPTCIGCGICINKCVNGAIYVTAAETYAINPYRCTECIDVSRRRCYLICPVGAIQPDPAFRETPAQLWEKHRQNQRTCDSNASTSHP